MSESDGDSAPGAQQCIHPDWRALTVGKRDVLVALARKGPASGADVHRRVRGHEPQTEPTTHRQIQQLEDAGLVDREQVDGRTMRCELSAAGWRLVRRGVLEPASAINVREAESDTDA
jgi:DNA-binding MarR family transcriptional regulator